MVDLSVLVLTGLSRKCVKSGVLAMQGVKHQRAAEERSGVCRTRCVTDGKTSRSETLKRIIVAEAARILVGNHRPHQPQLSPSARVRESLRNGSRGGLMFNRSPNEMRTEPVTLLWWWSRIFESKSPGLATGCTWPVRLRSLAGSLKSRTRVTVRYPRSKQEASTLARTPSA